MNSTVMFGFADFQQRFSRRYSPLVQVVDDIVILGNSLFQKPVSEPLHKLTRYIARTVANSFTALLILAANGCGTDALKIARGMFESALTMLYLRKHPELLNDYLDFRWVKRHKHYEYLKEHDPHALSRIKPEVIAESEAEYAKIERQFATKKWLRNGWCKDNLRDMAKDVGHEQTYAFIYPVTSSVHHLDIVGLGAQAEAEDVEVLPSPANIELAIAIAGIGLFVALDAYNEVACLGMDKEIRATFDAYKTALEKTKEPACLG